MLSECSITVVIIDVVQEILKFYNVYLCIRRRRFNCVNVVSLFESVHFPYYHSPTNPRKLNFPGLPLIIAGGDEHL